MVSSQQQPQHYVGKISTTAGEWTYDSQTGFDLTHSSSQTPRRPLTLNTTSVPITLDANKTALVIIDMQNFFLHPAFGRARGAGHAALDKLVDHAIPAARKASMQIIWLNWGLTEEDIASMPPAVSRAFGFACQETEGGGEMFAVDHCGERRAGKTNAGLGGDCGNLTDPNTGGKIAAGKLLTRGAWNAQLYPPLDAIYAANSSSASSKPDVWIHKSRMSGLWGSRTSNHLESYLEEEGIKTLLFTGVNTDQCVSGTLTDAFSKGFDCVLLRDGCGTTSPPAAQEGIEYNTTGPWGFCSSCVDLGAAVDRL